jgi:mannose-6-phosphate isomerase-like protein (cupin superfamily)
LLGGQEGAYHSHGEALKFYLKGRDREIIGGEEYDVDAGDLVFVPANTWHGSHNPSTDERLRFFAVTQGRRTPLAVQVPFKMRDDLRD